MRSILACLIGGMAAAVSLPAQTASSAYAFWTFAGRASTSGAIDGPATTARFNRPWGIAVDAQGNVYVTEAVSHIVRKITPSGVVTTLAGRAGEVGTDDGAGADARFASLSTNSVTGLSTNPIGPFGLAVDGGGNAFVADGNSHTLRRIGPTGMVSTFSGAADTIGSRDGPVLQARYYLPLGLAADAAGNLFVADTYNHVIRRISASGAVTTIAGSAGAQGSLDGVGSIARFLHPTAIAVSPNGNVYVADSNNTIRRVTPGAQDTWTVATMAGTALTSGTTDGAGAAARFGAPPIDPAIVSQAVSFPSFSASSASPTFIGVSYRLGDLPGLAADAAGNVYVSDFSNNAIRKISPAGVVTTIGGTTAAGITDGLGNVARFQRPCGIAVDAAGTLYIADSSNHTIRKGALAAAPVIQTQPSAQSVSVGATVSLSVAATGAPPPTVQWLRNGGVVSGATNSTLTLANVQSLQAGSYTARVTNAAGTTSSTPVALIVVGPPAIVLQPVSQSLLGGQAATLSTVATASPAATYQWFHDGAPVPGQTRASLTISAVQDAHDGEYRVLVSNALGTVTSNVVRLTVSTGRIINLSIRSALNGSEPLIAGFVVSGGSKPLLIRAAGPALRDFGVGNPMADPQLTLQVGANVSTNDNWSSAANAPEIARLAGEVGAFPLAPGSLDAAAFTTIVNTSVTAQTSARNNAGGVVLLELFETGGASLARLVNVSTRAQVGVGENALFAGFVIGGNSSRRLLIRAIGPTLGAFGVPGTLNDPFLELYASGATTARAENDNWNGDSNLVAAFAQAAAFALPATSSRDAALVALLAPGSYSARVSGVGNTTGEVLLEIYELP